MKLLRMAALAVVFYGLLAIAVTDLSASATGVVGNAAAPGTTATPAIPTLALKKLGSIPIGTGGTKSPGDGAIDFEIDDRGRFGFLKWEGPDGSKESFKLVDGDGKLERSIAVGGLPGFSIGSGHEHALAWIQGNRWLLTDSNDDPGAVPTTNAWWIDAGTGTATRIDGFDSPPIRRAVGTGDGGFVLLTDSRMGWWFRAFVPQELTAYDGNCKQRWMIVDEHPKDPEELFYFDDIAVTTNHVVAVLEDKGHKLADYGPDGHLLRIVDVSRGANDKLPHITSDGAGGILFQGYGVVPSRLTLDGKPIATPKLVYPGGRSLAPQSVRAAPGGQLWASDGYGLMRLDANGMADQVLGQPPINPDQLGPVMGSPLVSSNGSIYAIDQRTRSVHVFDDSGKHLRVIHPDAWFLNFEFDWASVSDRGDIFLQRRSSDATTHEFAHFGRNETHARIEAIVLKGTDDSSQTRVARSGNASHAPIAVNSARDAWWVLLAQPGGTTRWALNHDGLYRVDATGKVLRWSNQTAQGQKLQFIHQGAAVAPDGSIAIVSEVESHAGDPKAGRSTVVTLFSKSGDPVATWPVPDGMIGHYGTMATDGTRIAFLQRSVEASIASGKPGVASVVVTDLRGKPQFRFLPPPAANSSGPTPVVIYLVEHAGARELWLSDTNGTIDRYAMP
jgi:hypothetical protein